jgi:hypothetical protein
MSTVQSPSPLDASAVPATSRLTHRGRVVLLSVLVGAVIAALWSFEFVDSVIGDNVANTLLGYDAKETAIAGTLAGVIFAFVSGLAGSFTACNIACFSAIVPLMTERSTLRSRFGATLRPLGWLSVGMVAVSATYGAIGALLGDRLPQLSKDMVGNGVPVRLIQASVVFGLIGLAFIYLGLAALRLLPDPLERLSRRFPYARIVVLGGLIGGFLIGRPFPLFHKMFAYAAETHNALYGALVFTLQSLGNILVLAALFALLSTAAGSRVQRWVTATPGRAATVVASGLIIAGVFTFLYWDVRLPSLFGYGWYPTGPWS